MRKVNFQEGDYTFADAHLLTRVISYYGEVITNMFFVIVLRILEIWAFPSGRHVMMIHGPTRTTTWTTLTYIYRTQILGLHSLRFQHRTVFWRSCDQF